MQSCDSWTLVKENSDKKKNCQETRLFVWKVEYFDGLQLPQSLIFFIEILYTFPT